VPGRLAPGHRQGDQALRRRRPPGEGRLTNPAITPELFRERIGDSFPGDLGIEVVRIEDDEVEGRLEVDRRHLHPGGYVHGGVWVAFADTVAAWGTFRNLEAGQDFTTAELKANVFAAGRPGDVLTAIGRPLHIGRRTQVWEVRMEKDGRNAAFFTCTQMVLTS
jgi:1,4-dihydroxy-2-naphthoyl-CoA hydrolase